MRINLLVLTGVSLTVWLVACRHEPVIPASPLLTFDKDISPIITNTCAQSGCHDGSGEGGRLVTYNEVRDIVEPGKPYGSKLFQVITKLMGEQAMPPGAPLSDTQIRFIYTWILQGAVEK